MKDENMTELKDIMVKIQELYDMGNYKKKAELYSIFCTIDKIHREMFEQEQFQTTLIEGFCDALKGCSA